MLRSVWSAFMERVDSIFKYLRSGPTDVRPDNAHTDSQLRDGLYRLDHPDSDLFLSRPVRATDMDRMDDHGRLMREIADKSNKPNVASQPVEPRHVCARHPERTCNCSGNECGDDDDDWIRTYTDRAVAHFHRIDRQRNSKYIGRQFPVRTVPQHGHFECPVDGKACGSEWCVKGICTESWTRAKAGANWCFAEAAYDHRNTDADSTNARRCTETANVCAGSVQCERKL